MNLPRYYEDPSVLHVGTMPNRAYYIPFRQEDAARLGDRLLSDRLILLSGDWDFQYYPNRFEVPEDFMTPGSDGPFLAKGFLLRIFLYLSYCGSRSQTGRDAVLSGP